MRQRVSLMRALAIGADLLLLDEPFSALDDACKKEVAAFVKNANKNGLTVIVTHDEREAELLCATPLCCVGDPFGEIKHL